jgi:hypothetical protein
VFPRPGTTPHAALLLLQAMAARHREGADTATLDAETAELIGKYGRYWSQEYVTDPAALRAAAVDLLATMGLVTGRAGRVVPRPAAARFAPQVTIAAPAGPEGTVQESLL